MASTTWSPIEHIICMRHQLLKITGWQIKHPDHAELQKSSREYSAKEEARPGEKSCMVIDHLAQELIPYKIKKNQRLHQRYANNC